LLVAVGDGVHPESGRSWEWQTLGVADPGNGGPESPQGIYI